MYASICLFGWGGIYEDICNKSTHHILVNYYKNANCTWNLLIDLEWMMITWNVLCHQTLGNNYHCSYELTLNSTRGFQTSFDKWLCLMVHFMLTVTSVLLIFVSVSDVCAWQPFFSYGSWKHVAEVHVTFIIIDDIVFGNLAMWCCYAH